MNVREKLDNCIRRVLQLGSKLNIKEEEEPKEEKEEVIEVEEVDNEVKKDKNF